jgi:DNA-directed RNA polymerase alpha subunit
MEIHGGPQKRKRRKPADPEWLNFMSDDEKEEERIKHWQTVSLADIGLPVRVVNTLEDHGIMTVGDLCIKTTEELRDIQNLGEITITKCIKLLNELKLHHRLRT